jgi:CPA1 family monovalent cation:H+ antiporter
MTMHGETAQTVELILILLMAVALLATAARRFGIPYPILLVLGGLLLGFVPGLPRVVLAPDLVFLLFLPPILYAAAWFTSWRDFKANLRPIFLLSFGLVFATTVIVAVVAHAIIPGLPWGAAFVLGAIVSPPDAAAATAVVQRLGVPRRIVVFLEGESLINDAAALVALRFAVAAVVTGAFSLGEAAFQLLLVSIGGAAIGLALGWLVVWVERHLDDPPVEITLSFLAPLAAYLLAELLHVSGVLAVVVAGLYVGRRSARFFTADARLRGNTVWDLVIFLINGLIFVLIGLQLPHILEQLSSRSLATLIWQGVVISLVVILVRIAWVYPATYLPRFFSARTRAHDPYPSWRNVAVVAYTGLRGVVSLAAALALPLEVAGGQPFPARDLILFMTFCVILVTLVGQGLTLAPLIRWLGVRADDEDTAEEVKARSRGIAVAVARLDELATTGAARDGAVDYLRGYYAKRAHLVGARFGRLDHDHGMDGEADHDHHDEADHAAEHRQMLVDFQRLQQELLRVEREAVILLRDAGAIGDEVLHRIERDLDFEELRVRG